MKRILLFTGCTLFITALGMVTSCRESLEDQCAREAKTFTKKNCPAKLSDEITVDSMTFDKATHTLSYYYNMTLPAGETDYLPQDEWRKVLLRDLKNATSMKPYLDAGYNVQYIYYSAKEPGKLLFSAKFTPEDY